VSTVEQVVFGLIMAWLAASTALAIGYMMAGSSNAHILEACRTRGEWQMGQHRITCAVVKENV
jgi:hypothetical protein